METTGLEPVVPEAEDLQSPGVTNFPTSPKLGTGYGNRTRLTYVKGMCPKPIDEPSKNLAHRTGLEPVTLAVTGRCANQLR